MDLPIELWKIMVEQLNIVHTRECLLLLCKTASEAASCYITEQRKLYHLPLMDCRWIIEYNRFYDGIRRRQDDNFNLCGKYYYKKQRVWPIRGIYISKGQTPSVTVLNRKEGFCQVGNYYLSIKKCYVI